MSWQLVAFPLILPWRREFWTLPLYFPDLAVGVLWKWPREAPYRGMSLPPGAAAGDRDLKHYAPGEFRQWQAFQEYSRQPEEVEDLVKALKGEPPAPEGTPGSWSPPDALSLAWQLELMEADQESHLAQVDLENASLKEILSPEAWEDAGDYARLAGDLEILDPDTARLRYLLWRRELGAHLGPGSAPLLLSCTARAIFTSLRREGGGGPPRTVPATLPGCRSAAEFLAVQHQPATPGWRQEFTKLLGAVLTAAAGGVDLEGAGDDLRRWAADDLLRHWPGTPSCRWDLEIWAGDPATPDGGEALLAWGGLGREVLPG